MDASGDKDVVEIRRGILCQGLLLFAHQLDVLVGQPIELPPACRTDQGEDEGCRQERCLRP